MSHPTPKRRRSPWFAFYVDDYSGGTRTMSLAAKGAYVDLLGYQFQNGSVPDNDKLICRILGCLPDEWEVIKDEVIAKFYGIDGALINPRMEIERLERESYREKAAENGRKGGRPKKTEPFSPENRTLSENETQSKPNLKASPSPSPSPSSSEAAPPEVPPKPPKANGHRRPTLEQARAIAPQVGITPDVAEQWWHTREASGWMKGSAGGGTMPVGNWQSDMKVCAPKLGLAANNAKEMKGYG